jgi:hypothetical protein
MYVEDLKLYLVMELLDYPSDCDLIIYEKEHKEWPQFEQSDSRKYIWVVFLYGAI